MLIDQVRVTIRHSRAAIVDRRAAVRRARAAGIPMRELAREVGQPESTLRSWAQADPGGDQ